MLLAHQWRVESRRLERLGIGVDMKRILWATVSAIALASAAQAADLRPAYKAPGYPVTAAPAWAGGYIGIQGGVARQDATFTETAFGQAFSTDYNKTGGTFGGLAGYNWQHGTFVYGVEGDWNWVGAKITNDQAPDPINFNSGLASSFDVKWLATIRGRAGLAVDATLLYVTGGVAFGKVNNSVNFLNFDGTPFLAFNQSETKVGWTAGVGVEHMLTSNWTVRAEFRYVDLGSTKVDCTSPFAGNCGGSSYRGEFSNSLLMGLVGVNYKF
jgi:outer membrane immunogenic protein